MAAAKPVLMQLLRPSEQDSAPHAFVHLTPRLPALASPAGLANLAHTRQSQAPGLSAPAVLAFPMSPLPPPRRSLAGLSPAPRVRMAGP